MANVKNLLLFGAVFIVALLIAACGEKKPGIYINGQPIPLNIKAYGVMGSEREFTLPSNYPKIRASSPFKVETYEMGILFDRGCSAIGWELQPGNGGECWGPVPNKPTVDYFLSPVGASLAQESALSSGYSISNGLRSLIPAISSGDNHYRIPKDCQVIKMTWEEVSSYPPDGKAIGTIYSCNEGLPTCCYITFDDDTMPIALLVQ